MCVIMEVRKGLTFPYANLENAVLNNPHGVGVVFNINGEIEVERHLTEKPDPDFIAKLLEKHSGSDKIIHLRNRTRGDVSKENLHPFPVLNDKHNNIYLMHNGTFHDFKPVDQQSDTKAFVDQFVVPFLSKLKREKGVVDINDDVVRMVMQKFMGGAHNKILLCNKNQSPAFLGSWSKFTKDDVEFTVSNTDYFEKSVRNFSYGGHGGGGPQASNTFRGQQQNVKDSKEETKGREEKDEKVTKNIDLSNFNAVPGPNSSLSFVARINKESSKVLPKAIAELMCADSVNMPQTINMLDMGFLDESELIKFMSAGGSNISETAQFLFYMVDEIEGLVEKLRERTMKSNS